MSYLLDDLLDVARLQDQRISLQLEPIRAQAIVPGVMAMLHYMADGKSIKLQMNIEETLPPVMADEKRLVQIMYNLLHNALKFTEKGSITISAEVRNGQTVIEVAACESQCHLHQASSHRPVSDLIQSVPLVIHSDELQTRLAATASMLSATSTKRGSPEND